MKTVSLFRHINSSLNPYRWAISFVAAILVSGLFAGLSLGNRLSSDEKMAKALSPYLATLVESSDRPEMLRVLQSVATSIHSDVQLTVDDIVLATSRSVEELDRPIQLPKIYFNFFGHEISKSLILTSIDVKKSEESSIVAKLFILSPLIPSLLSSLGIFTFVFIMSILISFYSSRQMRKAIKKALKPLDQLHSEIKGMALISNETESDPIHIRELEEIRTTVQSTKIALENAQDQLAETKAKKLSADAYKRLIHDLHNPVAALRQRARLAHDETVDEETRTEASASIPRIADQILSQVTSAKKNLEEEPVALRDLNIIDCVNDGLKQVTAINSSKNIFTHIDLEKLSVPHDPILLKRAIVNLLENGIEAAKSQVRVSILKTDDNAIIKICDDGAGMDETAIPIYLQGRGTSGKANRQAFGLSSTNHIVRSHGGKLIYKKSDLGGSSFEIRLGVL